jgi:hypothetical protein
MNMQAVRVKGRWVLPDDSFDVRVGCMVSIEGSWGQIKDIDHAGLMDVEGVGPVHVSAVDRFMDFKEWIDELNGGLTEEYEVGQCPGKPTTISGSSL